MNDAIDIRVEDHGSTYVLIPETDAAREWIEEHIERDDGLQPHWPTLVVEARYVRDIIDGAIAYGLVVR